MKKVNYKIKHFEIHKYRLENGLSVILIPDFRTQTICINLAYKVGSKDEIVGKTGLAHLFEHLMFEGTKNLPRGEFDKFCSIAGGSNNAYTTYDYTTYTMSLPSHQLELGLYLESDRLFNFEISKEALENQKSVVIEEIKQTVENQPYGKWRQNQANAAYSKECSYSWEVHGKINDILNTNISDAEDFFNMYYKPSNASLVICGNFDINKTYKLIMKYFRNIRNDAAKERRNKFMKKYRRYNRSVTFEDNVPHSATFVSFHFDGFNDYESPESDILADIIGGGKSSHLYKTLVYKKQIASSVGAFTDKRENSSLLTLYAFANNKDVNSDILLNEMLEILTNIKRHGITSSEIKKAKNQLETNISFELQRLSGIADLSAYKDLFWGEPDRINNEIDMYDSINLDTVNNFLYNILNEKDMICVNVAPMK